MSGFIEFGEMVRRLEAAFPDFDIALLARKSYSDARNRVPVRIGWEIAIAEKVEKPADKKETP